MRPVISICVVAVVVIITCCSSADAHPFINLFNVAIKTDFKEDGNIVSFVYPKNKYQLSFKFNQESINEHSFDLSGLFQSIARHLKKKLGSFNPFKFLSPPTTTEAPLDLSDEDNGDSSVSVGDGYSYTANDKTLDDKIEENVATINDTKDDGEINGYEYPNQGTSVTIETAAVSYLPPTTPSSLYLPAN